MMVKLIEIRSFSDYKTTLCFQEIKKGFLSKYEHSIDKHDGNNSVDSQTNFLKG